MTTHELLRAGTVLDTTEDLSHKATALFSDDRMYRYALTRQWDDGPWLVFVMLNPSTADAFRMDPTVTRCYRRAQNLGAGGLLVLNAFALRSTDPASLRRHPDPVGPLNDRAIAAHVRALDVMHVVVGWGSDPTLAAAGRDRAVLAVLRDAGTRPMRIGPPTKDGHPRHPLYLRSELGLEPHDEAGAGG